MSATEFKATCLAVLDEVNQSGGSVNLTKRGKLVATLQAVEDRGWKSLENALCGQIVITDDIVNSNTSDDWEVFQRKSPPQKAKGPRRGPRTA
jgi:antitoxin (DNA-binding transcriptional repressor) of toxin-antitoxin stability system